MLGSTAVAIVYGPAIDTPFVFDDQDSVINNLSIQQLWPLVGNAEHPGPLRSPKNIPTSGRPMVGLSLALNYYFGGLTPRGYHLVSLLLHVLNATLLSSLVRRTLQLDYFAGRFDGAAGALSLAVALLWALHPLQSEAVIYVTQRTELLVTFFYLATLCSSVRYWTASSQGGRLTWLIAATLACLAGMASKENMVSAPLVVLLYQRAFISGSLRQALRDSWPLYVGLALGWLLLVYLNLDGPRSESAGFRPATPAYIWWFTQTKVLLMYLKLAIWPWPLVIHYHVPYLTFLEALPWLVPVASLILGTLYLLWRNRPAGFLLTAALLVLSPTLIVPIVTESAAERRMYLPLAALVTLFVVGGYWLLQRAFEPANLPARRLAVVILVTVALLLVPCGLVIARRIPAYHTELALWQDALLYQPGDPTVQSGLADALVRAGRTEEALPHYLAALELKPNAPQFVHNNFGVLLLLLNRTQDAIDHIQESLQLAPNYADAHSNLGHALTISGHPEQALEPLNRAVQLNPRLAHAHHNLAEALAALGRQQEAIDEFRRALELKPDYAEAHDGVGLALFLKGDKSRAVEHLREAVRLQSNLAKPQYHLGMVLLDAGKPAEAQKLLEKWKSLGGPEPAREVTAVYLYLGVKDYDRMFEWLEKAVDHRWFWANYLKVRPIFDPVRSDPRYYALLRKMRLPD
jgi:Flp pilus assembly protein TadD